MKRCHFVISSKSNYLLSKFYQKRICRNAHSQFSEQRTAILKNSPNSASYSPFSIFISGLLGVSAGILGGYLLAQQKSLNFIQQSYIIEYPPQFLTLLDRFNYYADLENEETGEKEMSQAAFIKSILAPRPNVPFFVAWKRKNGKLLVDSSLEEDRNLKMLLSFADVNSDGRISFNEYGFFVTLLMSSPRELEIAFKTFDEDSNNSLSLQEFSAVLSDVANRNINSQMNNNQNIGNGIIDFENNLAVKHLFKDRKSVV